MKKILGIRKEIRALKKEHELYYNSMKKQLDTLSPKDKKFLMERVLEEDILKRLKELRNKMKNTTKHLMKEESSLESISNSMVSIESFFLTSLMRMVE